MMGRNGGRWIWAGGIAGRGARGARPAPVEPAAESARWKTQLAGHWIGAASPKRLAHVALGSGGSVGPAGLRVGCRTVRRRFGDIAPDRRGPRVEVQPMGFPDSTLLVSSEDLVHALHRHPALTYCGGATFHRTGSHVACCENTWPARFQRPRQTIQAFPGWRVGDCVTGFDKALFIALYLRRQPTGAWHCADHGEDCRGLDNSSFVNSWVLQFDSLENFSAHHFPDLGVGQNFDILLRLHAARKVS